LPLENGRQLRITVQHQSEKNIYVKQVLVNGKPIAGTSIAHDDLMQGGEIVFVMTDKKTAQRLAEKLN